MKKFLSLFLCIVMILSVCTTMAVAADGDATETETTTDIRDTWWADPEWRAEFNAWVENYYTVVDGNSNAATTFEISSVPELYAFWRISLERVSKISEYNMVTEGENAWTSDNFKSLTNFKLVEMPTNSQYATRFTFVLTANLDLQGAEFPGIACFGGDFHGNGHTISNFKITNEVASGGYNGFFHRVGTAYRNRNVVIDNLILTNATVTSLTPASATTYKISYTGGLMGGTYYNDDSAKEGDNDSITVSNVIVDVDLVVSSTLSPSNYYYVGGFVGRTYYSKVALKLDNCMFSGSILATGTKRVRAGGLVADSANDASGYNTTSLDACMNVGTITLNTDSGSIARVITAAASSASMKNVNAECVNHFDLSKLSASDKTMTASTIGYRDLEANPFTLEDVAEAKRDKWYADEVYGIIPKGLAENVLYKVYAQQTTAPDANGKYKVRVLGALQSLDLQNVELDVQVSPDGETFTAVPVGTVKTVYTSVLAAGSTVTADDLGGNYLYGAVLTGIPAGASLTVKVTPTKTLLDGTKVVMATTTITLTFPAAE